MHDIFAVGKILVATGPECNESTSPAEAETDLVGIIVGVVLGSVLVIVITAVVITIFLLRGSFRGKFSPKTNK